MRVLQVHNEYYSGFGGEDTTAALEADLLRRRGHTVERLIVSTAELRGASLFRLGAAAVGTVWSISGYSAIKKAIARFVPDIIHVHNAFPLLSPSIFWAASKAKVPIIQTLQNFRLTCANALLLRDDRPCEQCVGRSPWPALRYRCYRGSLPQTALLVTTNAVHRWLRTFTRRVNVFIAVSEFSKAILVRAGLPETKIFVKRNFAVPPAEAPTERLPQVVFVGKISREKGVHLLLESWSEAPLPAGSRLLMIGDGPDRAELERKYAANSTILWCGRQPHEQVLPAISRSRWLVLPSICYENCPLSVLEAFSLGTPVIVPDHGPFPEMVAQRRDGILFSSGNVAALTAALGEGMNAPPEVWAAWSRGARNKYLAEYTEQANYERLMSIYDHALGRVQAERSPATDSGVLIQSKT